MAKSTGVRIIFVTGTDTGVGKTLLTALLLCHLRAKGHRVLALKPFCSGGRQDAELLHRLQRESLALDEINPFYFPEAVAPLISSRKHNRHISIGVVRRHIHLMGRRLAQRGPVQGRTRFRPNLQNIVIVEGSGGLLVPLGENYTVRDLIHQLPCEVVIVARNRLGTVNHTLLTVDSLGRRSRRRCSVKVVLMGQASADLSSRTNHRILRELLTPVPVFELRFLGRDCASISALERISKKSQKTLARISDSDIVTTLVL